MRTRCTDRIHRKRPLPKSPICSRNRKSTRAEYAIMTVNLLGMDHEALAAYCAGLGEKPFRARQLLHWIPQAGVDDFGAMTDMSKALRERLAGEASIVPPSVL